MQLSELKSLHVGQLLEMAIANEIEGANRLRKQELVFALLKNRAKKGEPIYEAVMDKYRALAPIELRTRIRLQG